jgi:chromosome segregation ATPase
MPLGLWKSKWEIHREDTTRFWAEIDRRHEEADRRWAELQEKSDTLRSDYNRELAETRLFNREVLLRMEKTYANLNATLVYVGEELAELKAAVNAQTEAIMKLVDRFEDWEKRQLG